MYVITLCSPQMAKVIADFPQDRAERPVRYPFAALEIGQSFTIPLWHITPRSMVSLAATAGSLLGRRFKILYHKELDLMEVARLA